MAPVKKFLPVVYALVLCALLLTFDVLHWHLAYPVASALTTAAVVVGIRINRPAHPTPWILLAIGTGLWFVGDLFWYGPGPQGPATFPSVADTIYLCSYPAVIAALGLILWSGDKDFRRGGLIDIAMIMIAIGMTVWHKGLAPAASGGVLNAGFIATAAFLVSDLVLVSIAIKLCLTRSRRTTSTIVLTAGLLVLLGTNLTSNVFQPAGGSLGADLMDSGWLLAYLAVGIAALHPSMARDHRHRQEPIENLTPLRMILISIVAIYGSLLLIPDMLEDEELGEIGMTVGIAAFFMLTLIRMSDMFQRTRAVNEELEQQAEKLRQAELRFRTIVEQTPATTYLTDRLETGPLTYISPQVAEMAGYRPEELVGRNDIRQLLFAPEDARRIGAELKAAVERDAPFSADVRVVRKDGTRLWVHLQSVLLPGNDGQPPTRLGVAVDVSDREKVKELGRALKREQEAVARLEALDEMKNTFLQAVSHELRTPLTTVKGLATTLRARMDDLDPDQIADLVGRIDKGADRLGRLLSDLLDVDRLSRGVFVPRCVQSNIGWIVREAAEGLELDDQNRMNIETNDENAIVDPSKVERIVENLCANARKHTPPDSQIWVSVRSVADGVLIEVADSGPGVPDELKESIFEPFNQGASESAHNQGLGLGLSLVRKFAELHGGRAWVEDRRGGGASFKVTLPRVPIFMQEEIPVTS